jgi:guanylate kinase
MSSSMDGRSTHEQSLGEESTDLKPADGPSTDGPPLANGAPGALLVIISGPSGVGKDTIIEALRRRSRERDYHYVVTYTTRAARPGEIDGV